MILQSFKQFISESIYDYSLQKEGNGYYVIVDGEKVAKIEPYKGTSESRSKGKRYVNNRKEVTRWAVTAFYKEGKSVRIYKNGNSIEFSRYMKHITKDDAARDAMSTLRAL